MPTGQPKRGRSCCSPWLKCSFLTPKPPTVLKESQDYNLLLSLFNHPVVSNSVTPWTAAHQASLSLTSFQCLPKFMSIASVMPFSHLILWCPLRLLPSIFCSIRDFSDESAVHIRWQKYWSFSFSIYLSNEYFGLISLKTDWFGLAIQGTLKSLLQHKRT